MGLNHDGVTASHGYVSLFPRKEFFLLKEEKLVLALQGNDWHLSISSSEISSYRTFILSFSSLHFILTNSSLLFHLVNFIFTNSSPPFYPTHLHPFYIICYISYPLNSYSSKLDLLFHPFNLILTISSSSNHSLDFIC